MPKPTYVIVLTPPGRGAVASVRVEGPAAVELVERRFVPAAGKARAEFPEGRLVYGRWGSSDGEEVVVCRREGLKFHQGADTPRSPLAMEVHCHGGQAAVRAIVASLIELGAREQDWADWAAAAAPDAITAEAHVALSQARTVRTASILLDQFNGALAREIASLRGALQNESIAHSAARLHALLDRAVTGLHLLRPWRVVLAGPPNVGKSSLINALAGYQRAIVFDQPGTTRDAVTAQTAIAGWPVELIDTAGLRASDDPLEAAGVALAEGQLAAAEVVVLVFDASQPWAKRDADLRRRWPHAVPVHNKCDLAPGAGDRCEGLSTSALRGQGIDTLVTAIAAKLGTASPPDAAVPFTHRQVDLLKEALAGVEAGQPAAADRLDELLHQRTRLTADTCP